MRFQERLLVGTPSVTQLLEKDPFAGGAPKYLRSTLYRYEFSELGTPHANTDWWQRRRLRAYCPVLTLQDGRLTIVPR